MILDTVEELPALRELRLGDCEPFREWLGEHQIKTSDMTFTNLFVWRQHRYVRISRYGDFLIIVRADHSGTPRPLAPIGKSNLAAATDAALELFANQFPGIPAWLNAVPAEIARQLETKGFKLEEDRDNFDYVYRVSDLARLEGRKYDGKRNQVRRCLEKNQCRYEPVRTDKLSDCLRLEEEWCNLRQCDQKPELEAEFRAIRETFEQYRRLGLFGGAVRINDRIQAFALGERLDEETAVVHFEKANPKIEGLYQVINKWFCENELSDYTWVNREQDLGIEGLRRAKMSYHPHHFIKKYRVSRAELS